MSGNGRRGGLYATAAAVLLAAGGVTAIVLGLQGGEQPPQPPPAAAVIATPTPSATTAPSTSPSGGTATSGRSSSAKSPAPSPTPSITGPHLDTSVPVDLDIPAIGVHTNLIELGQHKDGSVEVPPLGDNAPAGWYKYSPTPGQVGPALLLGHVDSAKDGPAVFFKLGALRQGDTVSVTREDGTVAVFKIERVVKYSKDNFPTLEVYGNTDHAALRLITCGGKFDLSQHSYTDNIVAYASMVSSHPA